MQGIGEGGGAAGAEAMAVREVAPEAWEAQGVVLVALDLTVVNCNAALQWALDHVVRKGDILRVVGVFTHVLNPLGYKSRVDEHSWTGANRKILETEVANKRYMLNNIKDLNTWCEKVEVKLAIEVRAGLHVHKIVVEEAKSSGAYHVVLDKTMKKERKYFVENLKCFVTRVRASGGVDSIRSFALRNQQPQLPASGAPTPFNTQNSSFYLSARPSLTTSSNDSLRGSSLSSTTFNQDLKELHIDESMGPPTTQDSITSSGTSTSSRGFDVLSCDDLFSININHEAVSERDASLDEPLAIIAPRSSAPMHRKGSGAQIDDTLKNSRPSSPRRSKRKQESLPQFDHSKLADSQLSRKISCRASFPPPFPPFAQSASHSQMGIDRRSVAYSLSSRPALQERSVNFTNLVFASSGVKLDYPLVSNPKCFDPEILLTPETNENLRFRMLLDAVVSLNLS